MKKTIFLLINISMLIGSCSTENKDNPRGAYKEVLVNTQIQSAVSSPTSVYLYIFKTDNTYVQQYSTIGSTISFSLPYGAGYDLCFTTKALSGFTNLRSYNMINLATSSENAKKVNNIFPYIEGENSKFFYATYATGAVDANSVSAINNIELKRPEAQISVRGYVPEVGAVKAYLRAPQSYGAYNMYSTYTGNIKPIIGKEIAFTGAPPYEISVRILPTTETSIASKTFTLCVYYDAPASKWIEINFISSNVGAITAGNNYVFALKENILILEPLITENWGTDIVAN